MAGVSKRGHRAAAIASASADASAPDQAAVTGTPTPAVASLPPVNADVPVPPADIVPAPPAGAEPDPATVLPDPTLTAEPQAPQPLVTASPPLAAEPDALDVIDAQRAAAEGGDPLADPLAIRPDLAVAGQPMLTIERDPLDVDRRDVGSDPAREHILANLWSFHPDERVKVVEVVGPARGRRRAGFAFGPEPRRFLGSQLTDEQLEAIRSDAMLTVGISELSAADVVGLRLGSSL